MRTIYNDNIYTNHFRGIHGLEALERQLPHIGEIFDRIVDHQDQMQQRITALEAAEQATAPTKTDNNDNIKQALMDAHNAIEQAISFFKRTAEENKQ